MRPLMLVALSCCLLAVAPLAHADASIERRLTERGVHFQKDDDGDYRVVYNYSKEGRTQLVFVSGSTETTDAFTVREVFAPAANVDDDHIDGAAALKLMTDSRHSKLGSWELNGRTLVYVIKLPDSVSAAELEDAMDMAATKADDMEIELSGGKDAY